jgi:hypothetical protein
MMHAAVSYGCVVWSLRWNLNNRQFNGNDCKSRVFFSLIFGNEGGIRMIARHMTVALIGSALLATAAMAQTPSATTDSKAAPAATSTTATTTATTSDSGFHGTWRSSKVIGLNVYNDSNEKLGSIGELLFDKSGKVQAAVIGVGGFLGVGQHDVAVAFDKLKFVDTPVPSTSASTSSGGGAGMRPGTTTGAAPSASTSSTTKSNPWYPDHAVFSATKDQLKSMPQFKYTQ